MTHIMAYAAAVPNDSKDAFTEHAKAMAAIFKEYGATRIVECWGSDLPPGEVTSFPIAVQAQEGETVVFGWQEWPSQQEQQTGFAAAMSDPRIREMGMPPMNGKTMIFGGFERLLDL